MTDALHGSLLYIEDDPVNVMVVRGLLEAHPGVRLLHAATGIEGLRLVQRERPQLVLLDMHLPDISGLEVVRRLDHAIASGALRVTLLTGDPMNLDIVKAMSLGAFEFWTKPLHHRRFLEGLRRCFSGARADPAHTLPLKRRALVQPQPEPED